ncbi:MAG: hypothetical protein ACXVA9_03660 [Bdellovibrionales bacterium]
MVNSVFWGDFNTMLNEGTSRVSSCFAADDYAGAKEKLSQINEDQEAVLFLTGEVLQYKVQQLAALTSARPTLNVVLVYETANAAQNFTWLEKIPTIRHIIPKNSENSRRFWTKPSAANLQPAALREKQEIEIVNSGDCETIYSQLSEYALKQDCFSGFEAVVLTSASELLTNAFYNGKRDPKTGAALVSDRNIKFALDPGELITLTFGRDDEYLWLIVRDCFGSLDRATLATALNRAACERKPILDSAGGAGLGLFMVYEWASEMLVTLDQGRSTTFACKFKLTKRNKIFEQELSALHIL